MHGNHWSCITCVACMSCSQCLSLMAWFCSSPTARRDVTMFLTLDSSPLKASHALISLSNPRISFTNFLHSSSIFSTLISDHRVVFQSVKLLNTRVMRSQRFFSIFTSTRHAFSCLNSGIFTSNSSAASLKAFISASIVRVDWWDCVNKRSSM